MKRFNKFTAKAIALLVCLSGTTFASSCTDDVLYVLDEATYFVEGLGGYYYDDYYYDDGCYDSCGSDWGFDFWLW